MPWWHCATLSCNQESCSRCSLRGPHITLRDMMSSSSHSARFFILQDIQWALATGQQAPGLRLFNSSHIAIVTHWNERWLLIYHCLLSISKKLQLDWGWSLAVSTWRHWFCNTVVETLQRYGNYHHKIWANLLSLWHFVQLLLNYLSIE